LDRRYAILDVFTDHPLAGNPLAVVLDGGGLGEHEMQRIAAEFNLSETVFVLPAQRPVHTAAVRIFTPRQELPFAGHPTVGTAILLAMQRLKRGEGVAESVIILEEKVGPVRCGVFVPGAHRGHAVFDAPRTPEAIASALDAEMLASALGLRPTEIGFENHAPSVFSAGAPYAFVPVRDLDVLARAKVVQERWMAALGDTSHAMYLYCRTTAAMGNQFRARCFAPGAGILEDPATGGAAAAFPGVILRFDQPPAGTHEYVIEQGLEMGRPSRIGLEVDVKGAGELAVRVSGDAVLIAEGVLSFDT
jgi:trans-2,3-dihydro-3-hydroxyanthranilate isomerase